MKHDSLSARHPTLVRPADPPAMIEAIQWAEACGMPLRRPSEYHLKVGRLNYWPKKGTLQFDTFPTRRERGLEAFKHFVKNGPHKPFGAEIRSDETGSLDDPFN